MFFRSLYRKVWHMAATLDDLKTDFESYQTLVTTTLAGLQASIDALKAQIPDPAKADALDAEMKAAIAALTPTPPTP